jgi:hypothetical protein
VSDEELRFMLEVEMFRDDAECDKVNSILIFPMSLYDEFPHMSEAKGEVPLPILPNPPMTML